MLFESQSEIQKVEGLPESAYFEAVEGDAAGRADALRSAKEYDDGMARLNQEYSRELQTILGPDHFSKYHALNEKRIEMVRQASREFGDRKALEEIRRRVAAESSTFQRENGIDVGKLKSLARDHADKAVALYSETEERADVTEITTAEPTNQDFFPPYSGWFWGHWASWSGTPAPDLYHIVHGSSGIMGNASFIEVEGADDYDFCKVRQRAAIRQWYKMPKSGHPRIRFTVKPLTSSPGAYFGDVYDEWGWSSVWIRQRTRFYVQRVTPNAMTQSAFTGAWINHTDTNEDSHNWGSVDVPLNQYYYTIGYITVPGPPLEAGDWVLIELGHSVENKFITNDCSVHSGVTQYWTVVSMGITAA